MKTQNYFNLIDDDWIPNFFIYSRNHSLIEDKLLHYLGMEGNILDLLGFFLNFGRSQLRHVFNDLQ